MNSSPRNALLAALLLSLSACGGRPERDQRAGTLSGTVHVTGPVRGAIVTAYAIDPATGDRGEGLAESEPTDEMGRFSLDMGIHSGPVLLEAQGPSAQYTEPASGAEATFEAATRMRALVASWPDPARAPAFGFEFADTIDDVAINPWTEVSVVYAETRLRLGMAETFLRAAEQSLTLWHEHLELDFTRVVPRSLIDGEVGPWDERVHAGVLATGLSHLARRIAVESSLSPAAVSSLSLVEALSSDLNDSQGQLDGCAKAVCASFADHLRLGACAEPATWTDAADKPICTLSGRTLRADLLESVAEFLDSDAGRGSGLSFGDVKDLMERIAMRQSALFPTADGGFDTEPPTIAIEPIAPEDLQPTALVEGTIQFRVVVTDAVEMGTGANRGVEPVALDRTGEAFVEGTGNPTVVRTEPDPRTRFIDVTFDTTVLHDGPLELAVDASDAAGNTASLSWTLHIDNSPNGKVAGTVMVGGRVSGAEVSVYDATDGTRGTLLGAALTDEEGGFIVTLAESPSTTALLIEARKPDDGDASYVEASSGQTIQLSPDDAVETVIADYIEGQLRNVQITPWTHIGTAFARGLFDSKYFHVADLWDDAVADAFSLLESHFDDGGPSVLLRTVRPADLTRPDESTSLNAQARYGLVIAALGQLADQHAAESAQSAASMNTMTLTRRLARDLRSDAFGEPLLSGTSADGALSHGLVPATSYWTRVDLSVAAVQFIETNERDASDFAESDVLSLLDWMALDANPRLYPIADSPIAYDLIPPGPVAFESPPTPATGSVLRGTLSLRARAEDNRRLSTFQWVTPGVTGALLDTSGGPEGPWVLSGTLATNCNSEGPLELRARATDEALRTTDVVHTVIVDCTPPQIAVTVATADGEPLTPGKFTAAPSITIEGTISDENGVAAATAAWQGGDPVPLSVAGDASWSLTLPLSEGANTLVLTATDPAGNAAQPISVTYYRDATPPTIVPPNGSFAGSIEDEAEFTVATSPTSVSYSGQGLDRPVVSAVAFSKYVTRYLDPTLPGVENLPEWRFSVSDNRSPSDSILFEVRIRRGDTPIVDWMALEAHDAGTYNRALLVHGGLAPTLVQHSGTYFLDYRATDELGNASPVGTVTWTQTLLPPPLHLAPGDVAEHLRVDPARIPTGYALGSSPLTVGGAVNALGQLVNGTVPTGTLRVAAWQVSNPNPVPVHFRPTAVLVAATWSTQTRHWIEKAGPTSVTRACGDGLTPQNLAGTACHTTAGQHGQLAVHAKNNRQLYRGTIEAYALSGGGLEFLPICAGCEVNERQIPPQTRVVFYAQSDPWTFLRLANGSMRDGFRLSAWPNVTGYAFEPFKDCSGMRVINDELRCVAQSRYDEVRHYTRVLVTFWPSNGAGVQSRLDVGSSVGFAGFAPGTRIAGAASEDYVDSETGFSAFTSHSQF